MDANGTRYHLLLNRPDWGECLADDQRRPLAESWWTSPIEHNTSGLEWNYAQSVLTLQPRQFQFKTSKYDDQLTFNRRRGAGRDGYGNWYWIAESGTELRVQSVGTGNSSHFWAAGDAVTTQSAPRRGAFGPIDPPSPPVALKLGGLAVTEDHYLVVGVLEPKGLLVFDLHATGAPRQLLWPTNVEFAPFDIAPRPGGGVWILDKDHRRYWALDRKLNVIRLDKATEISTPDDFQPLDPDHFRHAVTRPFPDAITLASSVPVAAHRPVAIAAVPDGTVLILETSDERKSFSKIYLYRLNQQLGQPVSVSVVLDVVEQADQPEFYLRGYDLAFVPNAEASKKTGLGQIFVVAMNGNQGYAFDAFNDGDQLKLQAQAAYYPMRLFGGKALVAAGDLAYYDFGEHWIPLIDQKRPRYEPEATLLTPVFDGREPECVWHRLLLDACIPTDSVVQVWSRAANERDQLEHAAWWPEPRLHQRADGSELPFVPKSTAADSGTWELLFQRARGRYLQLKITLSGNGRSTPRLHALRAYYPRFSYLEHYLPGVYREDDESTSFLDRFLANTEGTFTTLEDKIANVQLLLDVRSAPAETLDWLADWFGVVLDPVWDEARRRLFIKHGIDFFQYRGTARGLLIALQLAFNACVDESVFSPPGGAADQHQRHLSAYRIVEKYRTRQTPPMVLGDPTGDNAPREIDVKARWTPAQGRDNLNERYRLATGRLDDYPLRDPQDNHSKVWQNFSRQVLGFVPSATAADQARWTDFLARRYRDRKVFNTAYGTASGQPLIDFDELALPDRLPNDNAPLIDWFDFEGTVLAMRQAAHQFTVLLPAPTYLMDQQRQDRLELAQRVVNLEKPAHTTFDVKFYWALFRVGEARLGEDTLIDRGGRSPQLMPAFVLGRDYLSEGYLAPGYPLNIDDRSVVGRDRLTNDPGNPHHI